MWKIFLLLLELVAQKIKFHMLILTLLCLTEVDPKTALFSWRFIDNPLGVVDPLSIDLPFFGNWIFSSSSSAHEQETNYTTLSSGESAKIEFTFQIDSTQVYNFFYFQCLNDQNQSLISATCALSTLNNTYEIGLGNFDNYSTSSDLKKVSANITLKNNGKTNINFSLPIIIAYRSPFYSDISMTQQYPVIGQTKAVFCELFLNSSIGKIELHTIHVNSPHKIPSTFNPYNQIFGERTASFEFTTIPIISSETRIVGMNIFDSTLKLWRLYESEDKSEIGYCIDIDPVPPFRVTYIIIETSSTNFPDALEIWHNQFIDSFMLPEPEVNYGSIATPSSTDDFCITSFYQRHMWGGKLIEGFPPMKTFLPIPKFNITLPITPNDIINCSSNETYPHYADCMTVRMFGIAFQNNEFSVVKEADGNYTYNLIWSSNITYDNTAVSEYLKNHSYSGFAIDLDVARTMNYNQMIFDPQYFLIDKDGNRFKPMISSLYQILYFYRLIDVVRDGNILISDFFHPQFINVILTQGVVVNLVDPNDRNKLKYEMSSHNRLWRVRAQMGSCIFTILEESDPRSILHISEDYFSICLTLGALPSFYYPEWSDCLYLDYVDKLRAVIDNWAPRFRLVLYNTNYYANGIGLIHFNTSPEHQIPPIENETNISKNTQNKKSFLKKSALKKFLLNNNDTRLDSIYIEDDEEEEEENTSSYVFGTLSEENCFYEASTFCNKEDTEDDGLIDCYEVVLVGINMTFDNANDQITIQRVVSATFSVERNPVCVYASSPLTCTVDGLRVDLNLSTTASGPSIQMYRVALISFKYRISQSLEDWVRENMAAIVGALIGVLVLFIIIGFGFWYMYIKKRKDKEDLTRIMNKEMKVRQEKEDRNIKLGKKQLIEDRLKKDSDFLTIENA